MADPLAISVADPRFDPLKAVTINGFEFAPTRRSDGDRERRRGLVARLKDRARSKRADHQGFDAKLLEDAVAMIEEG